MKRKNSITLASLLLSAFGLVSCNGFPGAESGDLAPQRPTSQVSGYVVDDALRGALVNVYAFDGGSKGKLLGSATTAADGSYSLSIDSVRNRPVMIEVRGGSYVELASGIEISLKEDEVMKAVTIVRAGQPLTLMVTPLTHLAAALAEYRIGAGTAAEAAITQSNQEVRELFGLDALSVYPRSIADQGLDAGLNDEHLYGFYLAALSSWSKRISEKNGLAPHSVYNSIALSQLLYNEVIADGLLDGSGRTKAAPQPSALAAGVVALGPNTYRLAFAQHMLAMAAGRANATAISVDELLPRAFAIASSEHRLFAGVAPRLEGDNVAVSADENLGNYRSGLFNYAVTLGSPEMISSVRFEVDGMALPLDVVPGEMTVPLDTTLYTDGEHTLRMIAKDWLGNVVADHAAKFRFDNTSPYVNVTSGLYTNQQSYVLHGTLGDNGSGIQRFEVQGQAVNIAADNSWSANLSLAPGNNAVAVRLLDWAGNEFVQQLNVALDQTPPVIDSSAGHGAARFSNGSAQPVAAPLADNNDAAPIYQESNRLDLNGSVINRASMQQNGIPYFAFKVSDPLVNGVASAGDGLSVKMRYEKNGQVVSDWRSLSIVDGEYLLPLASETLHASWSQSLPGDAQVVRILSTDAAGNSSEKVFTFKLDIVVADFAIAQIEKLNSALFDNTAFSARVSLNNLTFAALGYSFTNDTGKAIYVSLRDAGGHGATRVYEKLVRQNKVREVATTIWRVGLIEEPNDMCLGTISDKPLVNVNGIYQFNGSNWVFVATPASVVSGPIDKDSDTPVPPADSPLVDVNLAAVFDSTHASKTSSESDLFYSSVTTYNYDYLLNINTVQGISRPVLVNNWQRTIDYTDPNVPDEQISCVNPPYFKQFKRYTYEQVSGYPADISEDQHESKSIDVAGYTVMDNTTSGEITPLNGWYRIPAGHTVTITKRIHTPLLGFSDDVEVHPAPYTTPLLFDKRITWSVNRELKITAVHDAGAANIFAMTPKEISAGSGAVEYSIAR